MTLTVEQLVYAAGLSLSQTRRWVRYRVFQPDRDGKRHYFSRADAVLGAVLGSLQRAVGQKSPVPLAFAAELRPILNDWLRCQHAISVSILHGATAVELVIDASKLRGVWQRLEELARRMP